MGYDGEKLPIYNGANHSGRCDQLVSLTGANYDFRKRTCDPSAGIYRAGTHKCDPETGGIFCIGVANHLNEIGRSCCKDGQSVCWQGEPTTADPRDDASGATTSAIASSAAAGLVVLAAAAMF